MSEPVFVPPSLRRRGPVRIDLTTRSGQCPPITRRRVHLRAGRPLVVQVIPQHASDLVQIIAEPPLLTIVPMSRIDAGPVPVYHAEISGHSPLRVIPLPITGRLHVSIADGLPNPTRITIPVTVWPSVWTIMLWWLVVCCSILGHRWQTTLAHSQSVWASLPELLGDLPYLVEVVLLGGVVILGLRILGTVVVITEPGDALDN